MKQPQLSSVEVKDAPEIPGEGKPRRNVYCPDKLIDSMPSGVQNLYENFKRGVEISGDRPCLGRRPIVDGKAQPYVWETYNQVHQKVLQSASAFKHYGLTKGSRLGILSVNRPEWVIVEQACNAAAIITVPLYDTLGAEAIEFIVNETEMEFVVASNDKLSSFTKDRQKFPTLKTVILLDGVNEEEKQQADAANIKIIAFSEVLETGKANPSDPSPGTYVDLVTIMYTSGTTGLPKGVMLSSQNVLSDAAGVDFLGSRGYCICITKDDVHLSYLPLAHVFERMVMTYVLGVGGAVGFFQGSALKLLDDLDQLKPTIFPSVPRLLNRIYDKVQSSVEAKGGMSASLFKSAVKAKTAGLRNGHLTHWLWDRLVFSKVKARLGGRVKAIFTGSAPIAPEVLDFLRLAFICEVYEGYGQTESCGGSSVTLTGDYESGNVGTPIPSCEIKLVDVPEMNYTSNDKPYPRGEICYRGPSIFSGYYKNEEKTKEAIDENGWLHSGDIGLWDEKGRLKIIDRKKNIFKLAQGEYIAPEKIENVYAKGKFVAQAFVYGDSLKAFLVAIIIPDEEVLVPWAKHQGIAGNSLADLIKDPKVKDAILKDMVKVGKDLGLKSFEQVKDIHLDSTLFSVENNLLTPTFKLKRPQAKEHYQAQLNEMIERVQAQEEEKEKKQNLAEEQKGK